MIAKRKGVAARWGLKEAWSKRASRCTRTGFEAHGAGRAASDREVHIHQGHWVKSFRKRSQAFLSLTAFPLDITTQMFFAHLVRRDSARSRASARGDRIV